MHNSCFNCRMYVLFSRNKWRHVSIQWRSQLSMCCLCSNRVNFCSYNQQTQWKTLEIRKSRDYYCILSFNQSVCGDLVAVEPETVPSKLLCLQTVSCNQGDRVTYSPQQFRTIGIFFSFWQAGTKTPGQAGTCAKTQREQKSVVTSQTSHPDDCISDDLEFCLWLSYSSDRIMLMNCF